MVDGLRLASSHTAEAGAVSVTSPQCNSTDARYQSICFALGFVRQQHAICRHRELATRHDRPVRSRLPTTCCRLQRLFKPVHWLDDHIAPLPLAL